MSIKNVYTLSVIMLVVAISIISSHGFQDVQATPQQVINHGKNLINMAKENWMFLAGIVALVIGVVWMANSTNK
jgi:hypothetical protein